MRVPGLNIVIDGVLLLSVAFSDVDEGVVETVVVSAAAGPFESEYRAPAMPRDIRDLMTIIRIRGIRDVDRLLIGVVEPRTEHPTQRQEEREISFGIDTVDFHRAEIEHRPSELLTLGVRNNLIRDAVVVIRDRYAQRGKTGFA